MLRVFIILIINLIVILDASQLYADVGVDLLQGKEIYKIGRQVSILEDPLGKLTIDDVSKEEYNPKFKRSKKDVPSYGITNSTFWVKVKINKLTHQSSSWFLSFEQVWCDYLEFYRFVDGKWSAIKTGDREVFSTREVKNRNFVFRINLNQKNKTYYFKIKSNDGVQVPLKLYSPTAFTEVENFKMAGFGIFYGIMIIMILYNLFIFISTKSISYFYYICFIGTSTLLNMATNGLAYQFLYPDWIWFQNEGFILRGMMTGFTLSLFTTSYLNIGKKNPLLKKIWRGINITCFVFIGLSTFPFYKTFLPLAYLFMALSFGLCFVSGIIKIRENYRPAKFYLMAFIFLFGGAIFQIGQIAGYLPSWFIFANGYQIGGVIEVVLLSLGLADIINTLLEENVKANELLEDANLNLEDKVKRRTIDLSMALNDISNLLDNMRQAVFTISKDCIVQKPVSKYSSTIFGHEIVEEDIFKNLYFNIDKSSELYSTIKFSFGILFGADDLQWEMVKDHFPTKINLKSDFIEKEKILKVAYSPLYNDEGLIVSVMLIVEDITEIQVLEKKMQAQQEEISKRGKILQELATNKKDEIQTFFDNANYLSNEAVSLWKVIRAQYQKGEEAIKNELNNFLRNLHTIKGNSRIYGFTAIGQKTHEIESMAIQLKQNNLAGRGMDEMNLLMTSLYELRGQINEYFKLARDIFGVESEDDSKFKNEFHEIYKDFEYWFGQPYFNGKGASSLLSSQLSFLINIFNLDDETRVRIFDSIRGNLHSLKGIARSMNERGLSENIHLFETTIHTLLLGDSLTKDEIDNSFKKPLFEIRKSAKDMYIGSSAFKPFNHQSEVWVNFFVGFFNLVSLFKESGPEKKEDAIHALYSLNYKSIGHHFLYIPTLLRSVYELFIKEDSINKEKIRVTFQRIWQHFKFLIQIDIEKTVPEKERESFKNKLSKPYKKEEWEQVIKAMTDELSLSEEPLIIRIFNVLIYEQVSINTFIENINFLENESKEHLIFEDIVPLTDVSSFLGDVYSSLRHNFVSESIQSIMILKKIKSKTLENLITIMEGIDEGWFPYLESIDLLRFLRDFIKEQEPDGDESVDKNTKPETYEVMVHNFNHLKDKVIKDLENKKAFSKKDVDLLFEELKRVPVKFSLKNLKVMAMEMGKSLGKKINFSIKGEQGAISKESLNLLKDAIVHLVRNSVDHGLEKPDERKLLNKDEYGNIEIKCYRNEKYQFVLEIRDDGRGILKETIIKKAIEQEFYTETDIKLMSDEEKLNIVFLPNFSTKENVTEISGRGIGMDVVKKNVEKINAEINLETEEGKGTTFKISLKA
tara:strand:+ start:4280 stop:8236 length:3957 start_codon:yes stop_codon:yes gene_type:complete